MTPIQIILIFLTFLFISIFLCIFVYFAWDRYVRQVRYLRAIMLTKEKGYKVLWLKKTGKSEQKYHVASNKKYGFFQYLDSDVVKVGRYNGIFIKEDSTHAISLDIKNVMYLDKTSINAESMKEILESKLIAELVEPKIRIADIILIAGIGLLVMGIAVLYYKMGKIAEGNALIMAKMDEVIKVMVEQSTQIIRPIK